MEHRGRNILPICRNHVAIIPKGTISYSSKGKDGEKSTKFYSFLSIVDEHKMFDSS